jgi:hypothetical protein
MREPQPEDARFFAEPCAVGEQNTGIARTLIKPLDGGIIVNRRVRVTP